MSGPLEHSLRERLSRRIFGHWSQRVVADRLAEYHALTADVQRHAVAGDWQGAQDVYASFAASMERQRKMNEKRS